VEIGMTDEKANEFDNLVKSKEKVYIFIHDFPDPDAMGAALGMKKLIEDRFEKPVFIFGTGFSRPQNKVMANVLNIDLKNAPEFLKGTIGINPADMILFVDVNENSGNLAYKEAVKLKPDWTIDHHIDKDKPLGNNAHLEPVGSSCTIVAEYLQHFEIKFDEEKKQDENVATALLLGLMTDTNNLLSVSVTPRDMKAFEYMKRHYGQETFNTIMDFELNPYYYDLMAYAHKSYIKEGSLIVLNLGYINADQEGALSFIAELWRRWKDVRVVIAFAVINNSVTGKVRVKGTGDIKASELARQVFQAPNGGGHDWMAGATAEFGPFFDTNLLDEEAKREFLHAITRIVVSRAKKLSQE
jgi:nanoRNase/pAp phosphatase (c-di-AMP/oligoRNAs hydrolase)